MPQTETLTANAIRQQFLDFFTQKHSHSFAPSSPVVPHDDPTLLFTNAGMNQFKDVFLGQGTRDYTRAVNTQKCIRAGGKHNDLEDVGKDTYHHTFFEMLGNWSFGDYFKAEAIRWAWELLTEVWGLDKGRLYVTVFEGDKEDGLEADEEAERLWRELTDIDPSHITRWGKKDNFWEMGDSGPCGPCSEIHFDSTPDGTGGDLVNKDDPNVIEIWNLVFIQFNRAPGKDGKSGSLTPLPAKHVDTGMGFERITRVLQGKTSNYDTDIWSPIFDAIQQKTGATAYGGSMEGAVDIAYRVIADHIRCLTMAITDGATPSNEGRGYVLRRILRRAVRIARQTLKVDGPMLCELVPAVVNTLSDAFPELKKNPQRIADVIEQEEEAFLKTIDRGIEHIEFELAQLLANAFASKQGYKVVTATSEAYFVSEHDDEQNLEPPAGSSWSFRLMRDSDECRLIVHGNVVELQRDEDIEDISQDVQKLVSELTLDASAAFKLHDTYGFPIDLTCVMAEERGMTVDVAGFEKLMEQAREKSRAGVEHEDAITLTPNAIDTLQKINVDPTDDSAKFAGKPISARIRAIWDGNSFDDVASINRRVAIILDRTNHYAEQGGQVGDTGMLTIDYEPGLGIREGEGGDRFEIETTQAIAAPGGSYVLHIGRVTSGKLKINDRVIADVDRGKREPIQANHTATHLLNFALRKVIGDEVDQKGSLVADDRLRFDFSSSRAMKIDEIKRVDALVNEAIEQDMEVFADTVPLEIANKINGLRAVFGEKYPDPVRVVSIGAPINDIVQDLENEKWREHSIEFCGGTHLASTGEAKHFAILQEQALAAGVRRITAVTGPAALAAHKAGEDLLKRLESAASLEGESLVSEFDEIATIAEQLPTGAVMKHRVYEKLDQLREKVKQVRKAAQASNRDAVVEQARQIAEAASDTVIVEQIDGADKDTLLAAMDVIKAKCANSAIMLLSPDAEEGKVSIAATVPKELIGKGLKAGDWVREAAKACGGGGGGRPDMAQAGGKQPEKTEDAMNTARAFAQEKLT